MIRIAIQSKGRLSDASIQYLRSKGLTFERSGRKLIARCRNRAVQILFLRSGDIPEYVKRGVAQFGIVGQNVLQESGLDIPVVETLDFGQCRLVIAVPKRSRIKSVQDLGGERIATSYPHLLSRYLIAQGVRAAVIVLRGSVEIAPQLGLSDGICDLVQTGGTLRENNLKPLATVMESRAVLIRSPLFTGNPPFNQDAEILDKLK